MAAVEKINDNHPVNHDYDPTGMQDIFVMGSIFSTSPMETSGIQRAQDT